MLRRRMMMGQGGGGGDYSKMYLTFKALESGTFSVSNIPGNSRYYYSLNGGSTWSALASGNSTPTIAAGDEICWRVSGLTPSSSYGIGTFSSTGTFNAYGNAMSIVDGNDFQSSTTVAYYQFYNLFSGSPVVSAENLVLPATTLNNQCYRAMFQGCTSLTVAPELPAETLAPYCYHGMFQGCTSLTVAPELPATLLVERCYSRMFRECSSLNYIKCLATSIVATDCVYSWTYRVASTGTFVKNPFMSSWPIDTNGIPEGWTVIDAT